LVRVIVEIVLSFRERRPAYNMTESEHAGVAFVAARLLADIDHFLARFIRIHRNAEQEVGVARREPASLLGSRSVHDGRQTVEGLRETIDPAQLEISAFPVEGGRVGPYFPDDVEPLLGQRIPRSVLTRQIDAESIVLGLVPAGDDIQP